MQNRLPKLSPTSNEVKHLSRSFANLLFKGKTSAATQLMARNGTGGVLYVNDPINNSVPGSPTVLKSKHPDTQPVSSAAIPRNGPKAPQVHSVIFHRIDSSCISALPHLGPREPQGPLVSTHTVGEGSVHHSSLLLMISATH